jgi:hypothetical protein
MFRESSQSILDYEYSDYQNAVLLRAIFQEGELYSINHKQLQIPSLYIVLLMATKTY